MSQKQFISIRAKLKRIEYLVVNRTSALISTAVAPPHGCGLRSRQPLDRSAPSTAQQCARAHQRCDRTDLVSAASLREQI